MRKNAFILLTVLILILSGCAFGESVNYTWVNASESHFANNNIIPNMEEPTLTITPFDKITISVAGSSFELSYTGSTYEEAYELRQHSYWYFKDNIDVPYDMCNAEYNDEYQLTQFDFSFKGELEYEELGAYAEEFVRTYADIEEFEKTIVPGENKITLQYVSQQENKPKIVYKMEMGLEIHDYDGKQTCFIKGYYSYNIDYLPMFSAEQLERMDLEKCNKMMENKVLKAYEDKKNVELIDIGDVQGTFYATKTGKLALSYYMDTTVSVKDYEGKITERNDPFIWCIISDITVDI